MNARAKPLQPATVSGAINLTALRIHVGQQVATAKIAEFENQAFSLGHFIKSGLLARSDAGDILLSVAESNGLVREQGDGIIQAIMAAGLEASE